VFPERPRILSGRTGKGPEEVRTALGGMCRSSWAKNRPRSTLRTVVGGFQGLKKEN